MGKEIVKCPSCSRIQQIELTGNEKTVMLECGHKYALPSVMTLCPTCEREFTIPFMYRNKTVKLACGHTTSIPELTICVKCNRAVSPRAMSSYEGEEHPICSECVSKNEIRKKAQKVMAVSSTGMKVFWAKVKNFIEMLDAKIQSYMEARKLEKERQFEASRNENLEKEKEIEERKASRLEKQEILEERKAEAVKHKQELKEAEQTRQKELVESGLKECKFCGEEIKRSARVCNFCGNDQKAKTPLQSQRPARKVIRSRGHELPPKSFTMHAVVAFLLYWLAWFPGFFFNWIFLREASAEEKRTGVSPPGSGCLFFLFMVHLGVFGAVVILILIAIFFHP